jgi:DNA-binding CsgD family transcriptional regulator
VTERLSRIDPSAIADADALVMLSVIALATGSMTETDRFAGPALQTLKEQGRLAGLGHLLVLWSTRQQMAGRFREAQLSLQEASAYAREIHEPFLGLTVRLRELEVLALDGGPVDERELRQAHPEAASALGGGALRIHYLLARGTSEAANGRSHDAFTTLSEVVDAAGASHHWNYGARGLAEYCDAASRSGHRAEATAVVRQYRALESFAESEQMRAVLLFCDAVLAEQEEALVKACDPAHATQPYLRSRALLIYGEWLRRHDRIAEARPWLRRARDELDAFGIRTWGDVARAELAATGERSARPRPAVGRSLTPQEERIVRLAAEGRTNREIAQALFLSPRTVAAHLYSAYPKLGVTGRSALLATDVVASWTDASG